MSIAITSAWSAVISVAMITLQALAMMLVSLVQVGDMRAAWKKMKAAGVTSDMGLRYAYISGVKATGSVPCCCCLNTICYLQ